MTATQPVLDCALTCPTCGWCSHEQMPAATCLYSYECRGCGRLLRPPRGECCIFCAYGSVPCPPAQVSARQRALHAPP